MEPYTRERAMEWLNKWWRGPKDCPICGHNNWGISESVTEVRPYTGAPFMVSGGVYPLFLVVCGTCGYTHFFNALVAGLEPMPIAKIEKTPSDEKKED